MHYIIILYDTLLHIRFADCRLYYCIIYRRFFRNRKFARNVQRTRGRLQERLTRDNLESQFHSEAIHT